MNFSCIFFSTSKFWKFTFLLTHKVLVLIFSQVVFMSLICTNLIYTNSVFTYLFNYLKKKNSHLLFVEMVFRAPKKSGNKNYFSDFDCVYFGNKLCSLFSHLFHIKSFFLVTAKQQHRLTYSNEVNLYSKKNYLISCVWVLSIKN